LLDLSGVRNVVGFLALALGCSVPASTDRDTAAPIASSPDGAVDAALRDTKSPTGGTCRRWEDCQFPDLCREPAVGPYRGGGGDAASCKQECDTDQHCVERNAQGFKICVTNPVGSGCRTCQPDCTRLACDMGQSCQPDGHCVATPCRMDGDCLPNFVCTVQRACARLPCRTDSQCQGACVNGSCYATPGACTPPAP
jgi:hypothetical protein